MFTKNSGIITAYYSGLHPKHAQAHRELTRAGYRYAEIHGSPYPEVAYAEMVRQALEANVEVVVFISANVAASVGAVEELIAAALSQHMVMGTEFPLLEFCAIPVNILRDVCAADDRRYKNSCVVDTGFSSGVPPLFSPFQKSGIPVAPCQYLGPADAFISRLFDCGHGVGKTTINADYKHLSSTVYDERRNVPERTAPGPRYGLCIPCFGPRDAEQFKAVEVLEAAGMPVFEVHGCPQIDVARSRLVQMALDEEDLDGVFFLDHDIIFQPKDVLAVIAEAEKNQAIVAAAYSMRRPGGNLIGALKAPPGSEHRWFEGGKLEPAFYTGLGFAAIPKATFAALESRLPALECDGFEKPLIPFFALDITGTFYTGEDVAFCNRVQGIDVSMRDGKWHIEDSIVAPTPFRIFIDTRIRIFHKGLYKFGLEDIGIVVPRLATMRGHVHASKEEALEAQYSVLDLEPKTAFDALQNAKAS
jgi:hypothetical protein